MFWENKEGRRICTLGCAPNQPILYIKRHQIVHWLRIKDKSLASTYHLVVYRISSPDMLSASFFLIIGTIWWSLIYNLAWFGAHPKVQIHHTNSLPFNTCTVVEKEAFKYFFSTKNAPPLPTGKQRRSSPNTPSQNTVHLLSAMNAMWKSMECLIRPQGSGALCIVHNNCGCMNLRECKGRVRKLKPQSKKHKENEIKSAFPSL